MITTDFTALPLILICSAIVKAAFTFTYHLEQGLLRR
jgi:hypothetical protein